MELAYAARQSQDSIRKRGFIMKFIETCKNIWKIEDLRQRLLTTALFVLIYFLIKRIIIDNLRKIANSIRNIAEITRRAELDAARIARERRIFRSIVFKYLTLVDD